MLQVKNLTDLNMKLLSDFFFDKYGDFFVCDLIKDKSSASKSIEIENRMVIRNSYLCVSQWKLIQPFVEIPETNLLNREGVFKESLQHSLLAPNPWISTSE